MLINKELNFLYEDCTLKEVIQSLNKKGVSYCVILERKSKNPVALISEDDLLELAGKDLYNNEARVSDLLLEIKENQKISADDSIASAVKLMYRNEFRNLLVINETNDQQVEGVIGARDFVSHLIEYFPETVYNVNLKPTTDDREGA